MTDGGRHIVVVGGGITGLSAAFAITQSAPEVRVTVLESSDRLGGKLHTEEFAGAQVETGADSFLTRDDGPLRLCSALGIDGELTGPAIFKGEVWDGRRMYELPLGAVMGIPTNARAILGAKALSPLGRVRALADAVLPGPLIGSDTSVGDLITKRFGREVLERLVDPLLAGTRAGDPNTMSLAAALPQVNAAARANKSVMKGLTEQGGSAERPRFLTPKGGMSRIIERLGEHLGGRVRTSTGVTRLARTQEGYEVEIEGPEVMSADAVVLTVPSPAAAEILTHLAPQAAHQLRAIAHASVAVIALAYEPDALPLDGSTSGFLVPSWAGKTLSAATWWSLKWPHTGTSDRVIVRCFVGRTGSDPALALDNEALAHAAATDIQDVLGTAARPTASKVTRWLAGLPQYQVGHLGRLAAIEGTLATLPGVALAGADYRGSGIPDCIRQGTEAAERVLRTTSRAAVG